MVVSLSEVVICVLWGWMPLGVFKFNRGDCWARRLPASCCLFSSPLSQAGSRFFLTVERSRIEACEFVDFLVGQLRRYAAHPRVDVIAASAVLESVELAGEVVPVLA